MSIPATIDVMNAVKARVEAVCAPLGALTVALTPPLAPDPNADMLAYLLHLAPAADTIKTAGATFNHIHRIEIGLWARTPDDAAETLLLAYSDAISGAFFQHKTLGGLANDAVLTVPAFPPYIRVGATTYRQRVWELEVTQRFAVTLM